MVHFLDSTKTPPSDEQLLAFEKQIEAKLPADYSQFLKQHNGGRPEPNGFDWGQPWGVECFFPLREIKPVEVRDVGFDDLVKWPVQCAWDDLQSDLKGLYAECVHRDPEYPLDRLLPIGTDGHGNYFCLVLHGTAAGELVLFDHETAEVTPLAKCFSEFVQSLTELPGGGEIKGVRESAGKSRRRVADESSARTKD